MIMTNSQHNYLLITCATFLTQMMLFLFRYRSKNKVGTQFEEKGFTNLNKNLKHCSACCYYEFY